MRFIQDGNRITGNIFQGTGSLVAVRVGLRGLHITLGIMRIIQFPVIYSAPCYTVVELLRSTEKKHGSHRSAERKAFDSYLVGLYIRKRLEVFGPGDEIGHRYICQILIYQVRTGTPAMPGSPSVSSYLDDAVILPPLVVPARSTPSVTHHRRIGAAVNIHMDRILP